MATWIAGTKVAIVGPDYTGSYLFIGYVGEIRDSRNHVPDGTRYEVSIWMPDDGGETGHRTWFRREALTPWEAPPVTDPEALESWLAH